MPLCSGSSAGNKGVGRFSSDRLGDTIVLQTRAKRPDSPIHRLEIDWSNLRTLTFEIPDTAVFRCLAIAYQVGRLGGTAPAWMSAANEIAVEAFLAGMIAWNQIPDIIEETLRHHDAVVPTTLDDIMVADASARRHAREALPI